MKIPYPKSILRVSWGVLPFLALLLGASWLLQTNLMATEDYGTISARPAMSPNGQEIVFSSDVTGTTKLWIATADGQSLRLLTSGVGIDDSPSWSPDGTTIAFSSRQNNVKDVWTIQRDGSNLRQLTSKTLNNFQPTWSTNGTRIAFVSDRSGTNDIWI